MMKNKFYTEFDREISGTRTTVQHDYRTPFQQDRDRLIHTSAFRRLQAKTQVFQPGEYDFYRTRLTHSLEVTQIGRSICNFLLAKGNPLSEDFHVDQDLVEACCLAHDIGHPPFGHAGETTLNRLMLPYGGFEANAQTLRLVAETIFSYSRSGLAPTRAFLDGIMKYKELWNPAKPQKNHFIYADQKKHVRFVAGTSELCVARHEPSIECQIMSWADDVAYSTGDIMDGVRARFINVQSLEYWRERNPTLAENGANQKALCELKEALKKKSMSRYIAILIGDLIQSVSLQPRDTNNIGSQTNRYKFQLVKEPAWESQCDMLKKIAADLVFRTPQVHQLEFKADRMLRLMFASYRKSYLGEELSGRALLPADTEALLSPIPQTDVSKRARVVCDHISGMSDDFAVRTYKRMFEGGFGSIADLV